MVVGKFNLWTSFLSYANRTGIVAAFVPKQSVSETRPSTKSHLYSSTHKNTAKYPTPSQQWTKCCQVRGFRSPASEPQCTSPKKTNKSWRTMLIRSSAASKWHHPTNSNSTRWAPHHLACPESVPVTCKTWDCRRWCRLQPKWCRPVRTSPAMRHHNRISSSPRLR